MINMLIYNAYGFAFFIGGRIGNDLDGTIGAIQLADAASVTRMEVILIMFQDQFALEPVEHFQFLTIFRILLSYNLFRMYKVVSGNHKSFPEGS
jgi:hypothetical protein